MDPAIKCVTQSTSHKENRKPAPYFLYQNLKALVCGCVKLYQSGHDPNVDINVQNMAMEYKVFTLRYDVVCGSASPPGQHPHCIITTL